jgi:hypothetical protein
MVLMNARRLVLSILATVAGVLACGNMPAFAAAPEAPELSVATPVPATSAGLRGVLNPKASGPSEAGTYEFLYKEGNAGCVGGSAAPAPAGLMTGVEHEEVFETLSGLTQHTEYTVCLRVENATHEEALSSPVTFKTALPPEAPQTTAVSAVTGTTAKLNGVLNPTHEGDPGTYEFFYRKSATECQGESTVGGSTEAHGVSPEPVAPEEVTGLTPSTTYSVCLLAINKAGESALGNSVSFTTLAVAPTVTEEFVGEVSSGSVTLHGLVHPGGADTTYRFEYGPTNTYGKTISGDAGAGLETVPVSVHPQDLSPGVAYHYRLVASNEIEEVAGPDSTFTTESSGSPFVLPDGRQWEMVSPPIKNGAEVSTINLLHGGDFQAAENGGAITYITSVPISAGARGNPLDPQVISRRGSNGWTSEDIDTPHNHGSAAEPGTGGILRTAVDEEYLAFSPGLSFGWVEPYASTPLVPGQPAPEAYPCCEYDIDSAYVRDMATNTYSLTRLNAAEWLVEQQLLAQGAKFTLESSVGGAGAGHGEFSSPQNVTAQQPSGSIAGLGGLRTLDALFVADRGNERVQAFSTKGEFLTEITGAGVPGGFKDMKGVAFDNSALVEPQAGEKHVFRPEFVYVVDGSAGVVDKFKPKGSGPAGGYEYVCQIVGPAGGCVKEGSSTFSGPSSVAVDVDGNVYVGQSGGPVEEFDSSGNFVAALGSGISSTVGIAVNATGNAVYVASHAGTVTKLSVDRVSHEVEGEVVLAEGDASAVAVDQPTGAVFIDRGVSGVREYVEAATGKPGEPPLAEFATKGEIGQGSLGIAATQEKGVPMVYVTDGNDHVLTYRLKVSGGCDPSTSPAKGLGVDAVSKDGCYVYFNSEAILAPGATGTDPLYVAHYENGAWTTTFISSLSGTGAPEWSGDYVELSPNGRYVAFMSSFALTGYDNRDANTGEPDEEVYLYDAVRDRLVCASCNPTGARPTGQFDPGGEGLFTGGELLVDRTSKWTGRRLAGVLPDWSLAGSGYGNVFLRLRQPRYVMDDGKLFFDSPDRLVAQDVNGLENVYEYEPEGLGGCSSANGCVSLISSGASNSESALVDASTSGEDVFFMTNSRLTAEDFDNLYDIYDAHACSASVPCSAPLVSPPACETSDSCKTPPSPQSAVFGDPASATFVGAGNVAKTVVAGKPRGRPKAKTKKCARGSHRDKHGKCVVRKATTKAKKSSRGSK